MLHPTDSRERGQAIVLFAGALVVLLLFVGLAVDAGFGLVQRRAAQNAADFAAIAGTRIVGEAMTGQPPGAGTDSNVMSAVQSILTANRAQLINARYISNTGAVLGNVGGGAIPPGTEGVIVDADMAWHPFFLGVIGVTDWTAGASATAHSSGVASGGVLPIGIKDTDFLDLPLCDHPEDPSLCDPSHLTPGTLNLPGGFGWLKFGSTGKCATFGLGMIEDGCASSQGFLQKEVGPPANSYGCCTDITLTPDSARKIGNMTGNKPADVSWYVDNHVIVWVPIWDYTGGNGANGWYHIVGFGAIILVGNDTQHGKWLTGVRVSATYGNTPNATLLGATGKVELVR